jgi:hypothetical protein
VKFAILRASLLLAAPVALFPGCFLIVGDLPPPLPEDEAAAGATDSAGGGSSGAPASAGGSAGSPGSAGATSNACDRDADGHDAEGACGGDDCDDQNPDVHPEQSKHFGARSSVDYDYDCDGKQEQEQMKAIICSELPIGDCTTEEGFLDTLPACGEPGVWGRCAKQGTLNTCMNQPTDNERVMRCQ